MNDAVAVRAPARRGAIHPGPRAARPFRRAAVSGVFGRLPTPRTLIAVAAVLLALTLVAPLWSTSMEAPQYHDEEALEVTVYAGRVAGDLEEIATLNQYVGVHLPLDTPELHASPWVLGGMLALALLGAALAPARRRTVAWLLLGVMLVVAVGGFAVLQYRLWQMGHVRDKSIFEGVPDFTPPVIGSKHIANFTVHMSIGWGGWAYAAALLLLGGSLLTTRKPRGTPLPTSA